LRLPDHLRTPADRDAVHQSVRMAAMCAPPAPRAAPTEPDDPSQEAEPIGWSDPMTSHRCESSGRVALLRTCESSRACESSSSSGSPKPAGTVDQ
jgi:hypothetical protein